jgi:GT2 family glycosyltransferase
VIPTFQGLELLPACLESVRRHTPDPATIALEVIVVDDASTDGSAEWVAREYPEVRLLRLDRNGGFARAANAGLAAATGEFIQLLNNDAEVSAGWAEAALAPFDDPAVGSVAPLVLLRRDPSRVDSAGDVYLFVGWPAKRGHGEAAASWQDRRDEEVFGPSGSSAVYRAAALRVVGGFDDRLGSYYEDIDLAFRLRWAGFRCRFAPDCRVLHDVSATYRHDRPDLQRRIARNAELVFWRNLPARWLPVAIPGHLLFVGLQFGWRLIRGRPGPFLAGKIDALKHSQQLGPDRRSRAASSTRTGLRPRFPLWFDPLPGLRNHLRRPPETSSFAPRAQESGTP